MPVGVFSLRAGDGAELGSFGYSRQVPEPRVSASAFLFPAPSAFRLAPPPVRLSPPTLRIRPLSSATTSATSAGSVGNGRRRERSSGLGEKTGRLLGTNQLCPDRGGGGSRGGRTEGGRQGSGYGSPPSHSRRAAQRAPGARLRQEGEVRAPRGRADRTTDSGRGVWGARATGGGSTPPYHPPRGEPVGPGELAGVVQSGARPLRRRRARLGRP